MAEKKIKQSRASTAENDKLYEKVNNLERPLDNNQELWVMKGLFVDWTIKANRPFFSLKALAENLDINTATLSSDTPALKVAPRLEILSSL